MCAQSSQDKQNRKAQENSLERSRGAPSFEGTATSGNPFNAFVAPTEAGTETVTFSRGF